jgi:DNA-directed RNA polymerase beta subunit
MEDESVWKLIDTYFRDNPQALVRHHVESYNDFFKTGIYQIFKNPIKIQSGFDEALGDYKHKCIMYFGGKTERSCISASRYYTRTRTPPIKTPPTPEFDICFPTSEA